LYWYATNIKIDTKPISQISDDDIGCILRVTGYIKDIRSIKQHYNVLLIDITTNHTILVFVAERLYHTELTPGTKIEVTGEVAEYEDRLEIMAIDIKIVQKSTDNVIEISTLLEIPSTFTDMNVTVTGTVVDLCIIKNFSRLRIADSSKNTIWVYLEKKDVEKPSFREIVDVYGVLHYDKKFYIIISSETDTIHFRNSSVQPPEGYKECYLPINDSSLIGEPVVIKNVIVIQFSELVGSSFKLFSKGYSISCIIFGYDISDIIENYTTVKFHGIFCYDSKTGRWQIRADTITIRPLFIF
jgi:hypothetical protein